MHSLTCKGFGFAMFKNDKDAENAIPALEALGFRACYAKQSASPDLTNEPLFDRLAKIKDTETSNVYLANLPLHFTQDTLLFMVTEYSLEKEVVSIKILTTREKISRGVGFIKMTSRDMAQRIIEIFDGLVLIGCKFPVEARFANSEAQKELRYKG